MPSDDRIVQLLTWTYDGPRFDKHGVNLADFRDLLCLGDLLLEIAKAVWRRDNPDAGRLPNNFEKGVSIGTFGFQPGSVVVPIHCEVKSPPPGVPNQLADEAGSKDILEKLPRAARVFKRALAAARGLEPMPPELPRQLLPRFRDLGTTLEPGDIVYVAVADEPDRVLFDLHSRKQLLEQAVMAWRDSIDTIGTITAASLTGKATLSVDGAQVEVPFDSSHEKTITHALHEHETVRVRVRGRGLMEGSAGKLKRITELDSIEVYREDVSSPANESLWEAIDDIAKGVSESEWSALPRDLAANVDRYIYNTAKRSPGS